MLDADVLHALPLRDTLLTLAARPFTLFRPCWSAEILDEVRRSLAQRFAPAAGDRAVAAMRRAFPDAMADVSEARIGEMPNHPKDRHVLALALDAGAPCIVTRNLRDFGGAQGLGVAVSHPDAFLCALLQMDAEAVHAALDRQAAALRRPPSTRAQLLGRLASTGLPEFARRVAM